MNVACCTLFITTPDKSRQGAREKHSHLIMPRARASQASPGPLLLAAFSLALFTSLFRVSVIYSPPVSVHVPPPAPAECGRQGDRYILCAEQKAMFLEQGLALLPDLITEAEMADIERIYTQYMKEGSPDIQGKDFCDMSKSFDTPRDEYSIINAMLPTRYYPELQDNIYERVAASIAAQLYPDVEMVFDYDQLLDKRPGAADALFGWHQDMAYWPTRDLTPDTRTVTFSLALDSTTITNGCIRYLPGSGVAKELRPHKPLLSGGNNTASDSDSSNGREKAHAIAAEVREEEQDLVRYAQVPRLSASMHDEWVVHGSGGNLGTGSRRTYVVAFRTADTVQRERRAGFTHSHNDEVNWDKFNAW